VLLILVNRIHNKLIRIAIDIGCRKNFFSSFCPVKTFRIKITRIIIKIGSVGIDKSTELSPDKSLSKIEIGVKKTATSRSNSILKNEYHSIKSKKGINRA
jgi:hypothetical protein